MALSFYSKNFNNYKIVGNILNPPKKEIKEIDINHENLGNIASINDIDNNSPLINEQEESRKDLEKALKKLLKGYGIIEKE